MDWGRRADSVRHNSWQRRALIGMGSIVTTTYRLIEIWAGIRRILSENDLTYETILFLQETQFWDWDDRKLAHYGPYMSSPSALRDAIEKGTRFLYENIDAYQLYIHVPTLRRIPLPQG